jgi:hypothetical protein
MANLANLRIAVPQLQCPECLLRLDPMEVKGRVLVTHSSEGFTRNSDGTYKGCLNNGKVFEVDPPMIAAKEI